MDFTKKYLLQPEIDLAEIHHALVFLATEGKIFRIADRKYISIIKGLDGRRSCEQIVNSLPSYKPEELYYCLYVLEDQGLLMETDLFSGYWDSSIVDEKKIMPAFMMSNVSGCSIRIKATSSIYSPGNDEFNLLEDPTMAGAKREKIIDVIFCSDYLDEELAEYYHMSMTQGHFFFPIRIMKNGCWFGPLFTPGKKPCLHCLTYRLKIKRPLHHFSPYGIKKRVCNPHIDQNEMTSALLYAFTHIFKEKVGQEGKLYHLDFSTMQRSEHGVTHRTQCNECGDKDYFVKRAEKPVVLHDRPRSCTGMGGYRCVELEVTWENYRHLSDPITGVVSQLKVARDKEHPLRTVYEAEYYLPLSTCTLQTGETIVQKCFGKGKSAEQSRISALCEALERISALYQGDEPVIRKSYNQLQDCAIDPDLLTNFSNSQYDGRDPTISLASALWVPRRYNHADSIDWTPCWSLNSHKTRYIPAQFCFINMPTSERERICPFSSNGNAAGNCIEEAILQGFLELVERDAVAIWWYNRISFPEIDLSSFNDDYITAIEAHYAEMGWKLWCLDITSDLKIPSVVAVVQKPETKDYYLGFGAHLDIQLALQRAITEISQVFHPTQRQLPLLNEEYLAKPQYLHPAIGKIRSAASYEKPSERSLNDDIDHCISIMNHHGLEILVLDYTRPDIELSTVKVIVPGLRHFWPRLGPGRLYDVPVKMGWLDCPLAEHQLNDQPLML